MLRFCLLTDLSCAMLGTRTWCNSCSFDEVGTQTRSSISTGGTGYQVPTLVNLLSGTRGKALWMNERDTRQTSCSYYVWHDTTTMILVGLLNGATCLQIEITCSTRQTSCSYYLLHDTIAMILVGLFNGAICFQIKITCPTISFTIKSKRPWSEAKSFDSTFLQGGMSVPHCTLRGQEVPIFFFFLKGSGPFHAGGTGCQKYQDCREAKCGFVVGMLLLYGSTIVLLTLMCYLLTISIGWSSFQ